MTHPPRLKTYRSRYNLTALIVALAAIGALAVMIFAAGWVVFWIARQF